MTPSRLQEEIKQTQSFEFAEQEAFLNILRTHGQMMLQMSRFMKSYGLSAPQYNIIRILRGAGEKGLPCQEISARMVSPVPDVTRLVDRLMKAGLVARQRGEEDRRVVRVTITRRGLKLLKEMDRPILDMHKKLLGHMDEKELEDINRLMVKARGSD